MRPARSTRALLPSDVLRTAAIPAVAVAVLALAGCGGEEPEPGTAAPGTTTFEVPEEDIEVEGMVGLEVSAVGNVSQIVDPNAFRLDKDGLGGPSDPPGNAAPGTYYDYYDYDYYDYDYLTRYDNDFGDGDIVNTGLLVVDVRGTKAAPVAVGDKLRVSGTIRRFEQSTIESVYGVNLVDEVYDPYEDRLVLVADSVTPADRAGNRAAGGNPPASPSAPPPPPPSG